MTFESHDSASSSIEICFSSGAGWGMSCWGVVCDGGEGEREMTNDCTFGVSRKDCGGCFSSGSGCFSILFSCVRKMVVSGLCSVYS